MPLQILQVLLTLRNFTSTIITSTAASVTAATATTVCLLTLALLFSLLLRLFFLFFLLGVLFGKHRSSDVTSNGRSPLALLWRRVGRRRTPRDCEHESLSILPQTLVPTRTAVRILKPACSLLKTPSCPHQYQSQTDPYNPI